MTQSPNTGSSHRVAILRFIVSASAVVDVIAYALAGATLALILVGFEVPLALALVGPLYDIIATPSRRYAVRWAHDILEAHGYRVHEGHVEKPGRKQRIAGAMIEHPHVVPITASDPSPQSKTSSAGGRRL